jgi:nitrate reductase gamma subunit
VVLVAAIVAGLATTVLSVFGGHEEVTYRETVSPWFRSLFYFSPKIDSMAAAPLAFQVHTLIGMLLFTIWPFTRLVHAFTVPLHYLFRPYIVYRSRDDLPAPGAAPTHRGWAPVGTRDRSPDA